MIGKAHRLVLPVLLTLMLTNCFGLQTPRDTTIATVHKVEELLSQSATRNDVIERLGRPLRYTSNEISYEYCRRKGGIVTHGPYSDDIDENLLCYELMLEFDKQGILRGYSKMPRRWQLDEQAEDLNLRELGKQGDAVAQKLWERSRTYYMSQQKDFVEERNENERKRLIEKRELASALENRAENGNAEAQFELYLLRDKVPVEWLCRAADQGYKKAELWLGHALETGTYGFPTDYAQSYLWYFRAAIGEHKQEIDKTIEKIKKKSPEHYYCIGGSCYLAQKIVDLRGKLDAEGISRAESLLEQWEPGKCEQEYSRTESGR